jgi:hypothetical protein
LSNHRGHADPLRALAAAVLAQAVKDSRREGTVGDAALSFLRGGGLLPLWAGAVGLEPEDVARGVESLTEKTPTRSG